MNRREALTWLGCAALSSSCTDSRPARCYELDAAIPILSAPRRLSLYPLKRKLLTDEVLHACLNIAVPDRRLTKFPLSFAEHLLRLWGPSAQFDYAALLTGVTEVPWGQMMLGLFVDDSLHARFARSSIKHLLVPSPFGVMVRTTRDAGSGHEWTVSHPGAYLQLAAEVGLSADHQLRLFGGRDARLADVVQDDARRFDSSVELEWTTYGLASYLDLAVGESWKTRTGELLDLSTLALHLCDKMAGQGTCCGTHVPYTLCALRAFNQDRQLVSREATRAIDTRIMALAARVAAMQQADGSWDRGWAEVAPYSAVTWGGEEIDKIDVTGHHLEWMTICPPELRPAEEVMERSVRYLARAIPHHGLLAVQSDWHAFLPLSHAAKALATTCGLTTPETVYSFWELKAA
jgi:hypothetical protein